MILEIEKRFRFKTYLTRIKFRLIQIQIQNLNFENFQAEISFLVCQCLSVNDRVRMKMTIIDKNNGVFEQK